jgi:hypothetical protein
MSSGGFPLGLDWSKNPESIPDGALTQAEQCEYDYGDGSLRTVAGVTIKLATGLAVVDTLFYDHVNVIWYFSSGTQLYKTDMVNITLLGTLTGTNKPVYCMYGGICLIASGGLLQTVSGGNNLAVVTGGPPVSHYVTSRIGRVLAFSLASDVLNYSAIGDYTSWTNNPNDSSSAQYVDIGYKDPGNIIAIGFLSKVIMVYKEGGRAYKIVGEPPSATYEVDPVSQTASCLSLFAATNVDDRSYYLGQGGLMSFTPTDDYGNVEPDETGLQINAWVAKNIDSNCQLWHVEPKKQIWVKTQNDKRVYLYHYVPQSAYAGSVNVRYDSGHGRFTVRTFAYQLNDVCCVGGTVYIAYGNKIGVLDASTDLDDAMQIQTSIVGNNKLTQLHSLLVMNRNFVSYNILDGYGTIQCGKKPKNITFSANSPYVYGSTAAVYGNSAYVYADAYTRSYKVGGGSNKGVQLSILVQKGAISVRQFDYQYLEV